MQANTQMEPTLLTVRAIMSRRSAAHLERWADRHSMKRFRLLALVVLAAANAGVAHADSDGYYCIGRSYLAYQFGMAPLPVAPHLLYVIRTRGPEGIPEPVALELPQFQVHGMRCGEGWIEVAAFTAVYRVILDESDRPIRYEVRPFLDGQQIPQEFIQSQLQNLGSSSGGRAYLKPIRIRLGTKERGGEYLLEVIAKAIQPVKQCELSIVSRIVETDLSGRRASERIIFRGRGHRECGE